MKKIRFKDKLWWKYTRLFLRVAIITTVFMAIIHALKKLGLIFEVKQMDHLEKALMLPTLHYAFAVSGIWAGSRKKRAAIREACYRKDKQAFISAAITRTTKLDHIFIGASALIILASAMYIDCKAIDPLLNTVFDFTTIFIMSVLLLVIREYHDTLSGICYHYMDIEPDWRKELEEALCNKCLH